MEAVGCGLGFLVLYLSTLPGNHIEAEDSVRYVNDVASGDPARMSNPYHLAYAWLGRGATEVAELFGWSGTPLVPLQVLNAAAGAVGLGLLWHLVRTQFEEEARGRLAAVGACGFTGFSYGYWWYSVEVEVYLVSVLLLVACLMLAHRAVRVGTPLAFATLGAVNGLAVLAHLTNVLFALVAFAALIMSGRRTLSTVFRPALAYGLAAVAVVLPIYVWAALSIGVDTVDDAQAWLNEYPSSDAWGNAQASAFLKAGLGIGREVVGGHFAYSFAPVQDLAGRLLAGSSLREEIFLVRSTSVASAVVLTLLASITLVALVALAGRWIQRPALPAGAQQLALLCAAWAVPYAVFFTWWEPENSEFWIATMVPIAILLALPLGTSATTKWAAGPRTVAVLLVALFATNLFGSVLPQRQPSSDYWRVRLAWYEANVRGSDLVLVGDYLQANYLDLHTVGMVSDTRPLIGSRSDADLRRRLSALAADADADRLLISSTALEGSAGSVRLLQSFIDGQSRILADGPEGEVVYEVTVP